MYNGTWSTCSSAIAICAAPMLRGSWQWRIAGWAGIGSKLFSNQEVAHAQSLQHEMAVRAHTHTHTMRTHAEGGRHRRTGMQARGIHVWECVRARAFVRVCARAGVRVRCVTRRACAAMSAKSCRGAAAVSRSQGTLSGCAVAAAIGPTMQRDRAMEGCGMGGIGSDRMFRQEVAHTQSLRFCL